MVISPVHFPYYELRFRDARKRFFAENERYTASGSWALVTVVRAIARQRGLRSVRVFIPDYICREPIELLEKEASVTVSFYPIGKDFQPAWDIVDTLIRKEKPDVFLLVHYFGFPNAVAEARAMCDRYGIALIEDCAHMLRPVGDVGRAGAAAVFSPWKFFPVSRLGVVSASDTLLPFIETLPPVRHPWAFVAWRIKREMQRAACALNIPWYRRERSQSSGDGGDRDGAPDMFSLRSFERWSCMADAIAERRRRHYQLLEASIGAVRPDAIVYSLRDGDVPYAFPCLTSGRAHDAAVALRSIGIPATTWPSLPDEVLRYSEAHPWAVHYAKHMLLLPIHQSISQRDIEYMVEQSSRFIS